MAIYTFVLVAIISLYLAYIRGSMVLLICGLALSYIAFLISKMTAKADTKVEESTTQIDLSNYFPYSMPINSQTQLSQLVGDRFSGHYVVFFDIDGVLHPKNSGTLERKLHLLDIISAIPSVEFVMSSNWRETCDYEWFINELNEPLISERIKGCTPVLSNGNRCHEIKLFCRHFDVKKFVAIDDRKDLFEKSFHTNVVFTDKNTGLTKKDTTTIIKHLISQ